MADYEAARDALDNWRALDGDIHEIPSTVVHYLLDCHGQEANVAGTLATLEALTDVCEECGGAGSHCDDSHPGNAATPCTHCHGLGRVPKGTPTYDDGVEHYQVGQQLAHHTGAVWEVDAARLPGDGVTWCGGSVLGDDDYIVRCVNAADPANLDRPGRLMRVHYDYLHGDGWTRMPPRPPRRYAGDMIRWSSGGSAHAGRITEVLAHGHVKVDTSPTVIPPAWILDSDDDERELETAREMALRVGACTDHIDAAEAEADEVPGGEGFAHG
jgi:hypothetical protein